MKIRRIAVPLLLVSILISGFAVSKDTLEEIRYLAIQHNGRVKPFDSFAREALAQITGSPRFKNQDPVETILRISVPSEKRESVPLISVPFIPLREALGLDRKTTHVSYEDLISARKLMKMLPPIVQKQQRDEKLTILENETMDVYNRFVLLSNLFGQKLNFVPPALDSTSQPLTASSSWLPIVNPSNGGYPADQEVSFRAEWFRLTSGISTGNSGAAISSARRLRELLLAANPKAYPSFWKLRLEVFYNRFQPFHLSMILYGLAALGLGLGWAGWVKGRICSWSMGLVWGGFLLHGMGIFLRVILGERPPVSNFYETMLWLPFVAVALCLFFERIYRSNVFALAASFLAAVVLLLADHLPLDPSISPVVAVLRSNLWLTVHVLTVVASYGALTLAVVLAHLYGILYLSRKEGSERRAAMEIFLYRSLQVGVVLLAAGIMLGGVWANASWGRFWGWDPKETWALITLLWFLAVLHGRFAGWLKGVGFALSTIGGFFLLLMTYYGVSFYLVGLHGYAGGHAKPLPVLLIVYLIAETVFMFSIGIAAANRRQPAS